MREGNKVKDVRVFVVTKVFWFRTHRDLTPQIHRFYAEKFMVISESVALNFYCIIPDKWIPCYLFAASKSTE
jgi:hypothetical protein